MDNAVFVHITVQKIAYRYSLAFNNRRISRVCRPEVYECRTRQQLSSQGRRLLRVGKMTDLNEDKFSEGL
jgi:hypothetical protein